MGIYKPLGTWVDEFIPLLYGNNGTLDPGTYIVIRGLIDLHESPRLDNHGTGLNIQRVPTNTPLDGGYTT